MGSTAKYGWQTPNPDEVPDVPTDMEELADDIEGTVSGLDEDLEPVRAGYIYSTTVYFTSSGAFLKANFPGLKAVRVVAVGGGGSCGGIGATGAGEGAEGGGGAGGEYAESFILAGALASSVTVTVGAGGPAAPAGANGEDGGQSSFGTHVVANGGEHGNLMTGGGGNDTTQGGEGGTGGTGDLVIDGGDGGPGRRVNDDIVHANYGGMSGRGWGPSAHTAIANTSGEAGRLYGGGSGGCNSGASQSARASTPGADGIVVVEVFV